MKYNNLTTKLFICLLFSNCKCQSISKSEYSSSEQILLNIFNDENGFINYGDKLDSIFLSLTFKVPCDFLDLLDKSLYNKIKAEADSFDIYKIEVSDGGYNFKCDPRNFELLKLSCNYHNFSNKDRQIEIINSIEQKLKKDELISMESTLLGLSMTNSTIFEALDLVDKFKENRNLFQTIILKLKYLSMYKDEYEILVQKLLEQNTGNFENYNLIISYFGFNCPLEKRMILKSIYEKELEIVKLENKFPNVQKDSIKINILKMIANLGIN